MSPATKYEKETKIAPQLDEESFDKMMETIGKLLWMEGMLVTSFTLPEKYLPTKDSTYQDIYGILMRGDFKLKRGSKKFIIEFEKKHDPICLKTKMDNNYDSRD